MSEIVVVPSLPVNSNGHENGESRGKYERFRKSQDFLKTAGVKRILTSVPVSKPDKQEFFWVRSGEAWSLTTDLLHLKEDREFFLVTPELAPDVGEYLIAATLFVYSTRAGVVKIWPVRMPRADGRRDEWSRTALLAATMAMDKWTRVVANTQLGAYEVAYATANIPEPEWPEATFEELLDIAFRDHVIETPDHPILLRLLGRQ